MRLPPHAVMRLARSRRLVTVSFWLMLIVTYTTVFIHAQGLAFPLDRDEMRFWATSQRFATAFGLADLRAYNEPETPLAFVVFGGFARAADRGLRLARGFNLGLSAAMFVLIAYAPGRVTMRSGLAAAGLLTCFYFIGVATHIYTDVIAAVCACLGLWLHLRGRFLPAAIAWVLAIATRQFMVAFPLAVVGWELLSRRRIEQGRRAWMMPLVAASSLAAWMVFFGGPTPQGDFGIWLGGQAPLSADRALYFLACAGVYFSLPNLVLFGRGPRVGWRHPRQAWIVAAGLAVAFAVAPPLENVQGAVRTMGFFDRSIHAIVDGWPGADVIRVAVFCVCAVWAALRVRRSSIAVWLLATNALVVVAAPHAWDKYVVPLVCALWLIEAHPRRSFC